MKLKVLHTETLKKWGGQQNRVLMECIGLSKRGHKMIIACHRGSILAQKAKEAGIKVYEVNMVKQAHLITIPKLIKIIKNENIDIVCTHSSVDSWAGGLSAKLTGRKLVRFRHNLYKIGKDPLTKLIYALPERIIAISDAIKDALISYGIRGDRITTINSSIDTTKFKNNTADLKSKLGIQNGTIVIGNTSTFTEVKGQEYLLQAFNIIARKIPCVLLFAGRLQEPAKNRYLLNVEEDLRDRVIFLGHRDDIPMILKTIDIFVYPSFMEGLGTALLEAMAMERPVLVSDIPTFRYFIKDGINGMFFKPRNYDDIAEKVIDIAFNENLRKSIGENARNTVIEEFSSEKMINETEVFYKKLITANEN